MPLEALREAKFSHKSDVFSFGVLLWEILSLGQTPWGAFGVQEFAGALARGERMPLPAALFQSQSNGRKEDQATHERAPEVSCSSVESDTVDAETSLGIVRKIYAVALRCWNGKPERRPPFCQLETEFAVHETVLASEVQQRDRAQSASSTNQQLSQESENVGCESLGPVRNGDSSAGARQAANFSSGRTTLDADGYVAESKVGTRPLLDAEGYVAEGTLEVESCAAEAAASAGRRPTVQADWYVEERSKRLVGAQGAARGRNGRSGIASRQCRKPSVYGGFDGSDTDGDDDTSSARPTVAAPKASQDVATIPSASAPYNLTQPSLSLGFGEEPGQPGGRKLHADETRL
jgi:hypothetical protein